MTTLQEACKALSEAVKDASIEVTFLADQSVIVHWCGVMKFSGTPSDAGKVIPLVKQLEKLGMGDC